MKFRKAGKVKMNRIKYMKWLPCLLLIPQACNPEGEKYRNILDARTGKLIAQCKISAVTKCGFYLNECTDGLEYFCMTNVRIK